MSTRALTDEELAALREQRRFLLRSLGDLEAERAAGDVDETDYETLREDYTVRAARVIRAIEAHEAREPEARSRRGRGRKLVVLAAVVAFSVAAGALVAATAGRRLAEDNLTGDIRTSTRSQLIEAFTLASEGDYGDAMAVYDEILAEQPQNVEALTYRGWAQTSSGDLLGGVESLTAAIELNPEYGDAHALLAMSYYRVAAATPEVADTFIGLAEEHVEVLGDLQVRADVRQELTRLQEELTSPGRAADEVSG